MATFAVQVHRVRVGEHPNADRLEIARIGGYRSCIAKGSVPDGALAAFVPDGGLVPEAVLAPMGLAGKLAGPQENRVRPIMLRKVLSQGLVIPPDHPLLAGHELREHADLTELLRITKYEPPVPDELKGRVVPAHRYCVDFDIEDWKMFPHVLNEGEEVVVTEKIHGICCMLGWGTECADLVTSKGLSHKGLVFDLAHEESHRIRYVQIWNEMKGTVRSIVRQVSNGQEVAHVLGEIAGPGVQELHYARKHAAFQVFDIRVGDRREGRWLGHDEVTAICEQHRLEHVPILYRGPYSERTMMDLTTGRSAVPGAQHTREGVVVRTVPPRVDEQIGRVILKNVSERYLAKGDRTEHGG